MDCILQTQNLVKRYGSNLAVNDVSLQINRGEIYGLIGKNGAGKTTLMRLILGLATPNKGKIFLFGKENDVKARAKIGSLIEKPAVFKNCSAYENMLRYSILFGADKSEIAPLLQLVGLSNTGKKTADEFSLGMRQRLAIAIALLNHPEILILDEPTNGLDPTGIKEIRDLILDLNSKGVTFIISSHLLDELAKVVTRYGIISGGRLIEEITAQELRERSTRSAKIVCDDCVKALNLLQSVCSDISAKLWAMNEIRLYSHLDKTAEINQFLVNNGIMVSEIGILHENYEDYYENFFIERLR